MYQLEELLDQIFSNEALAEEILKINDFNQLYYKFKELEPAITEDDLKSLLNSNFYYNDTVELDEHALQEIAGGNLLYMKKIAPVALSLLMFLSPSASALNISAVTNNNTTSQIKAKIKSNLNKASIKSQQILNKAKNFISNHKKAFAYGTALTIGAVAIAGGTGLLIKHHNDKNQTPNLDLVESDTHPLPTNSASKSSTASTISQAPPVSITNQTEPSAPATLLPTIMSSESVIMDTKNNLTRVKSDEKPKKSANSSDLADNIVKASKVLRVVPQDKRYDAPEKSTKEPDNLLYKCLEEKIAERDRWFMGWGDDRNFDDDLD